MSKMGSHDPFGYLKHKLWSKEKLRVKLSIWLPTTKSQESPQFPWVQVVCHILLESFRQGLQLVFKPHLDQRYAHKIMGLQSYRSPNLRDSHLGVPGQNDISVLVLWQGTKNIIRGKVVASPKFGPWWILWVHVCPRLVRAPKVLKLCINQLVIWFVQVRVSNWLACHSSYSLSRSSSKSLYHWSATN
jgi:hypothetical protein